MAISFNPNLKLPDDQYFHTSGIKSGICIHHTVGGSAASSVDWWKRDQQMVGTAFVIDRDGTIFQVFEPAAWAYQFGLKWNQQDKIAFEKRFIGIEIASEGGLIESGGNCYCFDKISQRTLKNKNDVFDCGKLYRGYRYFDKYETAQVDSLIQLINHLQQEYNIEKKIPSNYKDYFGQTLKNFNGVIGHVNIREDKSDPLPDDNFWSRVINECGLQLTNLNSTIVVSATSKLNKDQVEKLYQENLVQFNKMNRSAGNMVKGLLWELQDGGRDTYIRLHNAVENGHVVSYDLVQGDPSIIALAAQSLGFKSWDGNRLEVFNA